MTEPGPSAREYRQLAAEAEYERQDRYEEGRDAVLAEAHHGDPKAVAWFRGRR